MMLEKIGFQKNDATWELLRLVDIERQTLNPRSPPQVRRKSSNKSLISYDKKPYSYDEEALLV